MTVSSIALKCEIPNAVCRIFEVFCVSRNHAMHFMPNYNNNNNNKWKQPSIIAVHALGKHAMVYKNWQPTPTGCSVFSWANKENMSFHRFIVHQIIAYFCSIQNMYDLKYAYLKTKSFFLQTCTSPIFDASLRWPYLWWYIYSFVHKFRNLSSENVYL